MHLQKKKKKEKKNFFGLFFEVTKRVGHNKRLCVSLSARSAKNTLERKDDDDSRERERERERNFGYFLLTFVVFEYLLRHVFVEG